MLRQRREARGDLSGRQHEIDCAARDGALRHAAVLRGLLVLRERQAPGRLDLAQAQRAVGSRAGQDDADRVRALHRASERRKWSMG